MTLFFEIITFFTTRRHNPDTRPRIPCEECGKLFRIQADLRNHLSRTHRARLERKHRCNDCDLTFRSEKSLLSHMILHDPTRYHKIDFGQFSGILTP